MQPLAPPPRLLNYYRKKPITPYKQAARLDCGGQCSNLLLTSRVIFAILTNMSRPNRKFIALLMAFWLPLCSGYALADSIVMQNTGGNCHGGQQIAHSMQHDSVSLEHMHHVQLAANDHQSADRRDSQPPTCHDICGVCQLACSGFFAVTAIDIAVIEPSSQSFTLLSTEFESVTTAPLDPPPLARV